MLVRPANMSMAPIGEEQWLHIKEAWRIFDTDNDGKITTGDLRRLMLSFGYNHTEEELGLYLDDLAICIEKDRVLDMAEFTLWVLKLSEKIEKEDQDQEDEDDLDYEASIPRQATFANIVKREELITRRNNREALNTVLDEISRESEEKLVALIDKDNKGHVAYQDIETLALELGERYSFKELDAMMEAVTVSGQARKIGVKSMQDIVRSPLAWSEPDMLPCQAELLSNQENQRELERERAGGAVENVEKFGKDKRRRPEEVARKKKSGGGCGVM